MKHLFFLLILFTFTLPALVRAQEDGGNNTYKLHLEDIRFEEPTPMPARDATDTVLYGNEREEFNKHGYVIRHSSSPSGLTFSLSPMRIGFDPQPDETTVEKTVVGSVAGDNQYSYQLFVAQQKLFTSNTGSTIDNTGCDVAHLSCTSTLARRWQSSGAYGFGYRVEGNDIPFDFHDRTHYRPFPLISNNDEPLVLLNKNNISGTRQFQLFLKLNFPPSFQESTYTGDLSIIALPKL